MIRKKIVPMIALFTMIIVFSCASRPKIANDAATEEESLWVYVEQLPFDPAKISQEHYISTKEDVRQFIERLNQLIQRRDYNAWKSFLSPEYYAYISSEEHLRQLSELPVMRNRQIVLRTTEDYFIHVVVPSRANLRVDDIEFISENRVKAFTININRAGEEVRLRLYDLEKIDNTWTIIN